MMIIVRTILSFTALLLTLSVNNSYCNYCEESNNAQKFRDDISITTDNRIKVYEYNPNLVYLLVLHSGFQSNIEFEKGEAVETIHIGESYAWKITPLANRLFVKPLEKNMRTNMTIITNKRIYQFDVVSKDLECGCERELVYVVRFDYPKKVKNYCKK